MRFNKLYNRENIKEIGDIWLLRKNEIKENELINYKDYLINNKEMQEGIMKYYENLIKKGEIKAMYRAIDGENKEILLIINNNDKAIEVLQIAKVKEKEEWTNFINWGGNNNIVIMKELKEEMIEIMNRIKKD